MSSHLKLIDVEENDGDTQATPSQRQDSESSASVSEYAPSDFNQIPSSEQEKEIVVYRDGVRGARLLVSSTDKTPLYYLRCSVFRPSIPDMTLFAGGDRHGAVVGVCHVPFFSSSIMVGRGDPANPNAVEWEQVSKKSRDHSRFEFSFGTGSGERKSYLWKRTHDPNIKGTQSSKIDRRSWKLEDEAGQVVAVYASNGINWKKTGKFRFLVHEGKEWEEWVLLTCLALSEHARRLAMARRDLSWFI